MVLRFLLLFIISTYVVADDNVIKAYISSRASAQTGQRTYAGALVKILQEMEGVKIEKTHYNDNKPVRRNGPRALLCFLPCTLERDALVLLCRAARAAQLTLRSLLFRFGRTMNGASFLTKSFRHLQRTRSCSGTQSPAVNQIR